ncbi:MAG TPA: hypothetical protein VIF34_07345 [Methylocystis sp.]
MLHSVFLTQAAAPIPAFLLDLPPLSDPWSGPELADIYGEETLGSWENPYLLTERQAGLWRYHERIASALQCAFAAALGEGETRTLYVTVRFWARISRWIEPGVYSHRRLGERGRRRRPVTAETFLAKGKRAPFCRLNDCPIEILDLVRGAIEEELDAAPAEVTPIEISRALDLTLVRKRRWGVKGLPATDDFGDDRRAADAARKRASRAEQRAATGQGAKQTAVAIANQIGVRPDTLRAHARRKGRTFEEVALDILDARASSSAEPTICIAGAARELGMKPDSLRAKIRRDGRPAVEIIAELRADAFVAPGCCRAVSRLASARLAIENAGEGVSLEPRTQNATNATDLDVDPQPCCNPSLAELETVPRPLPKIVSAGWDADATANTATSDNDPVHDVEAQQAAFDAIEHLIGRHRPIAIDEKSRSPVAPAVPEPARRPNAKPNNGMTYASV